MPLNLECNTPFPWKKRGRVELPPIAGFSYASHPCIVHLHDDRFLLGFNCRDAQRRTHTFLAYAEVSDGELRLASEPKMALAPGATGGFDEDGAIGCCFVRNEGVIYLYYVGWQNLQDGLFSNDTGRAIVEPETRTIRREFAGPVLGRDRQNPLFAAATAFHIEGDVWRAWYNSGIKWEKVETGWKHYYGLHHAHSRDGVTWTCDPGQCLPFQDEYEYAFGRPSVYVTNGLYLMWFAHRATKTIDTYRIGFAWSKDGIHWTRNDALSGIDVSPEGWDSEMICYPCVFEHNGRMYMLYNGNGYGRTGFGYAVLD